MSDTLESVSEQILEEEKEFLALQYRLGSLKNQIADKNALLRTLRARRSQLEHEARRDARDAMDEALRERQR